MKVELNLKPTKDNPVILYVKIGDEYRQVYFRNSEKFEEWREYDEKGNEIYFRDSYKYECWKEYDEKGNQTYYRDSNKYESWREYDDKGYQTYFRNSNGVERGKKRCTHKEVHNCCPNCGVKLKGDKND